MKHCAVICEYNPLHNGHAYQLSEIRNRTDCTGIICVMSGDFVQRAEPAIVNKLERTKCALRSGADILVQLPAAYAAGNGETFAKGAIQIVNRLPDVEYLAMGCETEYTDLLTILADIQLNETTRLKKILDKNLNNGLSYAASYADATAKIAENYNIDYNMCDITLSKPNNLLCIEYLKALKRINSNITPVMIRRDDSKSVSSSEIRKRIGADKNIENIGKFVPSCTMNTLIEEQRTHRLSMQTYSDIVIHTIRNMSAAQIAEVADCAEGIEYRISKTCADSVDYFDLLKKVKTKRYTLSRLKRICLQCLLGIKRDTISDITAPTAQILGIKSDFKHYLSSLPSDFFVKFPSSKETNTQSPLLEIEKTAHNLYALLTHNNDYKLYNKLITV